MTKNERADDKRETLIIDGCEIRINYAEKSNLEYIELMKALLIQQFCK